MDVQDHKKTTSSEHEIHGVHLCHRCGWPFPNPHPSAKHRRAHKRVCGIIEGYKLIDSESDHANFAGSDNEHLSDDEQRTPSPKVDKGSTKELGSSGGIGFKSSPSEDELFSDAVTEFSDNAVSPSLEKHLESVKELDKNVGGELLHDLKDSHVSKDEKTADKSQPLHGLTQPLQGPGKASEMSDSDVVGSERNQPEITKSISDIRTENVSFGVSSTNCVEFDSSRVVSEFVAVSDNSTTDGEIGKEKELMSSGLGTDIKEKEKGDEVVDVHSTAASEVLQSEHKLEIEPKLEEIEGKASVPLALEALALETEKETSDPHVEPDLKSKLNNVNGETSHAGIVDETVNQEKELTNDLQSKHDVSSQIEPPKFEDASVVSESNAAKNLILSSHGQSDEVCDVNKAGNEDTHLLSVAKTLPAVENPEVMIGDFKDFKVLKSSFPLDLGAAEEIRSAEDDKKVPIPENHPSAFSNVPAGSIDSSSSDALEGDLEKEGVSTPIGGEVSISAPENLPSALSSVPAGTIDDSSSDALVGDLEKEGVSTPICGEVGTSVPENLPSALSSAPAGTVDNSSSEALDDDIKKLGVPTPIDGEVGTAVPENLPSALSSVPAGTVDNSSSEALEDDLKKEGVPTPIDGEVGTSVPENLPCALSSMPAGTVDNSSSEALEDDLKKEGVPTPINGEVGTSVPENLPSAFSSVPAGTVDNSSSEALEDDLKKEGVPTPIDGEVATSVPENLPSALSSVPAGTVDNSSSEALENDLKKEGVSTPIDGEVGTFVPEKLPSALPSVPAGTVDNSSADDFENDLKKEAISTPIDGEVSSSGFRVTRDEDTHLLSVAETLPAVENPEAMIGDFKDYKVLKSNFSLDLGAAEEIRSVENDKKVTVPDNLPNALSNVPAGSLDNSSSDTLEDDFKNEGVSIPIDGEVGASGFRGTSDEDTHLLSVAETSPAVENPEVMIGDFKDYKVLKSSFPLDLGAAEEIRSVEDDKEVTVPENLPSALSNVPAGSIDNSSSDALEDDLKKEGVSSIPIDGEIGASGFSVTGDADFGSSGLGDHPKTSGSETNNSQLNNNLEVSLPQSGDGKLLQNEDSEPTIREYSDVMPLKSSTGEQTWQATNLYGGENADNHGMDKLFCVATENGNVQAGEEVSANVTTTLTHVETIPETIEKSISLAGDDSLGHENSRVGFSSIAGNETVEVAAEEKLVKHGDTTHESTQQLINSASLDEARGSNQVDIDVRDSGKLCNSSESRKCSDEIPIAFEGLKMGDETEVPRSSGTPGMVSEPKYEDPTVPSEKTSENSSSKEVAAFPVESEFLNKNSASVEDMNIRDAIILGPFLDDGEDKVTKQNFSVPAVDYSFVSSSRTDSLEGTWGSVSVLSTQSDVTAVPDAEVPSLTDIQAAEKLDGDFKKPQAASTECHDKSDVFEPPSFMTLVESGVGVKKNAAASEIQTAQRDEQTKSEALQAGWFPSLTNVVNESEGRKKNEEIIAKVTNWSTGKQSSPLKNLLSEAHAETKVKSPNTKQVPAVNQADETASKNNGTAVTTVGSILGSEMPSADTVKKEMEKEWNSPARYPIQIKKEKRKGKPYWVPFVCCTSVHQDV